MGEIEKGEGKVGKHDKEPDLIGRYVTDLWVTKYQPIPKAKQGLGLHKRRVLHIGILLGHGEVTIKGC